MTAAAITSALPSGLRVSPSTGLRALLREATSQAHTRLDGRLGALNLRSRDGYRRFLEINAAALLPLETALAEARVERIVPDWRIRSRGHAILDDLAALNGRAEPVPVPFAIDDKRMLGAVYVLEGSRLGARFLLETVTASEDTVIRHATSFLSHGAGLRLWPTFLALLEGHGDAAANDRAAMIDGARRTFDLFSQAADIA